ncbi:MAG: DNA polymerase III subunit alpha [Flavobacteriales bacterium]|nr:DNA polymerase III subunit alpha [Flavobacteriales bacterium]MBK7296820.1 DNA polymerase III subunit alpha [Flavobacteriales bacterium]MBP9138968.1 DNA polymerase III subunit alpha [Flavobacteriales bacterium]
MLLNTHSWFSLNYGVLSPEQVLQEAHDLGLQQVALTDVNCTAGWSDLFRLADKYKVRPLAGIEFKRGARTLYIGIARNNLGLHQLAGLLTDELLDDMPLPERAPEMPDAFIIYPFGAPNIPEKPRPNEYIGIRPNDVNRLRFSPFIRHKEHLLALATATFRSDPLLAKRDFNVHRLKRAVDTNMLLSTTPPEHVAASTNRFLSEEQLCAAFADVPELVWNTRRLIDQCDVHFAHGKSKNRRTWSSDASADLELLRQETQAGIVRRFGTPSQAVLDRVHRELTVIAQKDFVSYFLINWDLIRFAKNKGFFHVGRGSGANSLVAYCLGITDVDPIELDLYFERFINPSRSSPPDFDLDFSWKDRDQVTQYLFDKYGADRRVALLATYSTYQRRAVIRELGKVFGLPPDDIHALANEGRMHSQWVGRHANAMDKSAGPVVEHDRIVRTIMRYSEHFIEHPHHLSIHVGGVLISEKPLTHYTALRMPPKGFATTQFSMLEAEDLGLYKFDILSQRGLGHIRDAVELVEKNEEFRMENEECRMTAVADPASTWSPQDSQSVDSSSLEILHSSFPQGSHSVDHSTFSILNSPFRPKAVDIHAIEQFKHDPKIKELLRTGDTIGCFYVESPAMRMLLKKLGVQDYLTLVAASSIIRPGVAQSGMMREYILRHRDPERRKQAHPAMYTIMPDTYGVMVYQEDVIKVAHLYAGLSLAEADILRRGMSGKYRSREEFQRVKDRFFSNCKRKGYPDHESAEIWRQIESFAGYSFAKGHSASYAVESYQSLYLKAYHPLEFMVAVANNFGGFYHTEFYLHEARRGGAVIEAPCVNRSDELCKLDRLRRNEKCKMKNLECRTRTTEDLAAIDSPVISADHEQSAHSIENSSFSIRHSPFREAAVFLGLQNIKSLNTETVNTVLNERRRNGPFADLPDLLHRVHIHVEQARMLIRVGAFRFTGRSKPQLLWDLTLLHPGAKKTDHTNDLFITEPPKTRLPKLQHFDLADAYDELELLGFPLCDPFILVECVLNRNPVLTTGQAATTQRTEASIIDTSPVPKVSIQNLGNGRLRVADRRNASGDPTTNNGQPTTILAKQMPDHIGKRVTMLGYVVHIKPTTTLSGQRMSFGSFIDPAGDFWDSTQFPDIERRYPFRGRGVYRLTGKVEMEFEHCSLSVQHVEKLPWKVDPRYGEK